MGSHVVDPPEDVHLSRDEVLESVASRRGITVEELKRRREVAGLDSTSEGNDDTSEEATIEG